MDKKELRKKQLEYRKKANMAGENLLRAYYDGRVSAIDQMLDGIITIDEQSLKKEMERCMKEARKYTKLVEDTDIPNLVAACNDGKIDQFMEIYEEIQEKRLWITPSNDLEAKTIVEMLEREGEDVLVTGQAWGASWGGLETSILKELEARVDIEDNAELEKIDELDSQISSLGWSDEEQKKKQELTAIRKDIAQSILRNVNEKASKEGIFSLYGVELEGPSNGAVNVDHHKYYSEDRSNPNASIEQVADILGVELTLDEKFVAANDKGFIPAMEKLGAELGIDGQDLQEIIANIRMRDRQMQGITMEQEAQAQEAVEALGEIEEKKDYIQMDLPHSKTSTVTDRLYGKYGNLLITSSNGETNFYGQTELINMLNEKFPGGWSGGQLDQGNGFWGGYADQEAIKAAVQEMIDKMKSEGKGENNGQNLDEDDSHDSI